MPSRGWRSTWWRLQLDECFTFLTSGWDVASSLLIRTLHYVDCMLSHRAPLTSDWPSAPIAIGCWCLWEANRSKATVLGTMQNIKPNCQKLALGKNLSLTVRCWWPGWVRIKVVHFKQNEKHLLPLWFVKEWHFGAFWFVIVLFLYELKKNTNDQPRLMAT